MLLALVLLSNAEQKTHTCCYYLCTHTSITPPISPSVHRFILYTLFYKCPVSSSLHRQTGQCVWQPSVCQFTFVTDLPPINHSTAQTGLHARLVTSVSLPPPFHALLHPSASFSHPVSSPSQYEWVWRSRGSEGRKKRRHKKDRAGDRQGGGGCRSGAWYLQHCVDGAWSGLSCSSW